MRVNPYIEPLLQNTIELLNDPPNYPGELEQRWSAHGMPAQKPATTDDLAILTRYLAHWRRVIDADTDQERVAHLNRMLHAYTAAPAITDHDGSGWHLHFRDPDAGFGLTLAGATSAAAAQFLTARGMHRLGRCRLTECGRAFVDLSRPSTQRYCSHTCANRDAVRRHRSRADPIHRQQRGRHAGG